MAKLDLNKTPKELMYTLLSKTCGFTITENDVSYHNVKIIADDQDTYYNTSLELRSVAGSSVIKPSKNEPLVRKYYRWSLDEVASQEGVSTNINDDIDRYQSPQYVIEKVNALLGVKLTQEMVDILVGEEIERTCEVTVTLHDTAHTALIGTLTLYVNDTDSRERMSSAFARDELDGF